MSDLTEARKRLAIMELLEPETFEGRCYRDDLRAAFARINALETTTSRDIAEQVQTHIDTFLAGMRATHESLKARLARIAEILPLKGGQPMLTKEEYAELKTLIHGKESA